MESQADTPAGRGPEAPCPAGTATKSWRDSPWQCAAVSLVATGLLGAGLMALSIQQYGSYGGVLFCLSPGISAFLAVLLHEWARPSGGDSMWRITKAVVGVLAVLFSLLCLLTFQLEGFICIAMALPVAFVMAIMGAALGTVVVQVTSKSRPLPMLLTVLVLYPAAQQYEVSHPAAAVPRLITTQLEVAAPPARVWAVLMQPVQYPAATGWFRAGVVYPTRTALAYDPATGRRTRVCR